MDIRHVNAVSSLQRRFESIESKETTRYHMCRRRDPECEGDEGLSGKQKKKGAHSVVCTKRRRGKRSGEGQLPKSTAERPSTRASTLPSLPRTSYIPTGSAPSSPHSRTHTVAPERPKRVLGRLQTLSIGNASTSFHGATDSQSE
jgi:hypothetical protein